MNVVHSKHLKSAGSFAIVLRTLFDSCFNVLGKLILVVLHWVYKLNLGNLLNKELQSVDALRTSIKTDSSNDEILLKNEVLLFSKIPQHVTLIAGAESPSYKDLIKIIQWSIFAGISHVSFYDHHNGIDSEELFKYMFKYAKHYIPLVKWGKSFTEEIKQSSKEQINGYAWKAVLTVHVFSAGDWSASVQRAVEDLRAEDSPDVSVGTLDSTLRKNFFAPDPDLALVIGPALSFYGFPPWHLRITQIQSVPSHHNISVATFLEGLREYSSCQQRYGK